MRQNRGKLCAVPSRLRGRRTGRFESSSGEGTECEKGSETSGAKRDRGPLLRSVNAKTNSRQQCSLTWKNLLAGWPSSKSVELLQFPTPCSLSPAMLGIPAASRKSSSPALHETRTLCGAGADISGIRLPVKPSRAVPPKSDVPPRQPLDLAKVLAKLTTVLDRPRSSRSLEEEFGVDPGVATTEAEHTEVLNGGESGEGGLQRLGVHAQVQRILRPRHEYPGVFILPHDTSHRDRRRSPRREQNRRIRNASTRCCVRSTGYSSVQRSDLTFGWPLLGLSDPDARLDVHWSRPQQSSHGTGKRRRSRQQRNN